jgi:hypothetical protein
VRQIGTTRERSSKKVTWPPTNSSSAIVYWTLVRTAFQYCLPTFEVYTGEDYDTSQLWVGYFVPDESAWSAGDRVMQCYLYLPEQTLTGSRAR